MDIEIPGSIKVGGYDYQVRFLYGDKHLFSDRCYGQFRHTPQQIDIESSTGPQQTNETFIHEILEAIDHIYCNDELDHTHLTLLARGIHQVTQQLGINFVQGGG